jgi:hypothetical protein
MTLFKALGGAAGSKARQHDLQWYPRGVLFHGRASSQASPAVQHFASIGRGFGLQSRPDRRWGPFYQ